MTKHKKKLALFPIRGEPLRLIPRNGEPQCILEWFSQNLIRLIVAPIIYCAIVATLCLALLFFVTFRVI